MSNPDPVLMNVLLDIREALQVMSRRLELIDQRISARPIVVYAVGKMQAEDFMKVIEKWLDEEYKDKSYRPTVLVIPLSPGASVDLS